MTSHDFIFFNIILYVLSKCLSVDYPARIGIDDLRWNIQPSCGCWSTALNITMWGPWEEVFYLTIFQESHNYARDFRVLGVVILINGSLCRWRRKVTTAVVVPLGHLYVPYITSGTLFASLYCPRSIYSLKLSIRVQEPSVWWNLSEFPFILICSKGGFWFISSAVP